MLTLPTLDEIELELATRSLAEYIRQAWHLVEPGAVYVPGWHIDAIAEHLEAATCGQIRNLIINIPPRHMKSLLCCVFWFTWVWAKRPETRWIFASHSEGLAIRDSLKCRRIIQSDWYQQRWGGVFQLAGDQNQKARFENDHMGYRLATGVGGGATGEGGDFLVGDDLLKARDAHSTATRSEANEFWDNTMSTRGNNPNTVVKVLIMQRLHEQDLTGHLLEKMQSDGQHYEHLCLPAQYETTQRVTGLGWRDPRTVAGQLLWPERFGAAALADLKSSMGSYAVAGQLQQRPAPDEGGIFKRRWWRYWRPAGVRMPAVVVKLEDGELLEVEAVELPGQFDEQLQSWDMAFKESRDSDFVAGQVWSRVGANKYLLDYVQERMGITGSIEGVKKFAGKWPGARAKLIEDKANGPAVIQILKDQLAGLIAVDPEGGKISRAHAVAPAVEAGNVYLPHPALFPWVAGFIDSCAGFPNMAHDDDVDAFTQAQIRMQQKRKMAGVRG